MNAEIYYFSGTGNSLTLARSIAKEIAGQLIPIASVMDQAAITTDAKVIGIVFPVYFASNDNGIPLIVGRFISKLQFTGLQYVFAVCTHGGGPGCTIENLQKMIQLRGGKLAAGFTLQMNNKINHPTMLNDRQKKLQAICEYVTDGRTGRYETRGVLGKILIAPFMLLIKPVFLRRYQNLAQESHQPFQTLIPLADRSFQVGEQCDGCGICARVCPVGNINIGNHRPVWQHHCENCYACYSWCPKTAIFGEIVKYNERYHHPKIKLTDMLRD